MRTAPALFVLFLSPLAAWAQGLPVEWQGLWGSDQDEARSCAANPHRFDLTGGGRPHLVMTWDKPFLDWDGRPTARAIYDMEVAADLSLTLTRDDRPEEDPVTGLAVTWVLRLSEDGRSYCRGRPDWTLVRCEDRMQRCDSAVPSS